MAAEQTSIGESTVPAPKSFVDTEAMRLLSDPLRVHVFAVLCEQTATAKELAAITGGSPNNIRHALARLADADWVASDGSGRGTRYHAVRPFLLPPEAWELLPLDAQGALAANLLRLLYRDARGSLEHGVFVHPEGHLSLTPLVLDERGRTDAGNLISDAIDGLLTIQAEASKRLAKEGGDSAGVSMTVAAAAFESVRDPGEGVKAAQRVLI